MVNWEGNYFGVGILGHPFMSHSAEEQLSILMPKTRSVAENRCLGVRRNFFLSGRWEVFKGANGGNGKFKNIVCIRGGKNQTLLTQGAFFKCVSFPLIGTDGIQDALALNADMRTKIWAEKVECNRPGGRQENVLAWSSSSEDKASVSKSLPCECVFSTHQLNEQRQTSLIQ